MDERLEAVSEKIRMGIPVSMTEAIEAIDSESAHAIAALCGRVKSMLGRLR